MSDERCVICGETEDSTEALHDLTPTHVHEFLPLSKVLPKVWLVWTGQYSDASVVGVYSSLELAQASAAMHVAERGWISETDGYVVDGDAPQIREGVSRWELRIRLDDGEIGEIEQAGPGSGETQVMHLKADSYNATERLFVRCDARDLNHATKIAGDERAKFLALRSQVTS